MWDELNRILGVKRKDELSGSTALPDVVSPGPVNEPGPAGGETPVQSPRELERLEPAGVAEPEQSPPEADDAAGASPRDDAEWARIFADESSVDAPLESDLLESDGEQPPTDDGPATAFDEPRPFGFARPRAPPATIGPPAGAARPEPRPEQGAGA